MIGLESSYAGAPDGACISATDLDRETLGKFRLEICGVTPALGQDCF